MPRANRYWLPGHVWHLTHRCHRRQFLLRFVRDRRLWTKWLYEARVRHGLCVLDFVVTSNHVHLVVRDRGLDIDVRRLWRAASILRAGSYATI
jgi:putative transposase